MAAYTTYKVVLAAIGLKRSKRTESLAEKALRTIAFTDALVSVLTLQNTLIVVMDGGMGGKIQPSAVLVIQNGQTKLVNVKNQDGITKLLDMVPEFVEKFSKKNEKNEKDGE